MHDGICNASFGRAPAPESLRCLGVGRILRASLENLVLALLVLLLTSHSFEAGMSSSLAQQLLHLDLILYRQCPSFAFLESSHHSSEFHAQLFSLQRLPPTTH